MANATSGYVELHARSAFSFLEGASLPERLASRCAELDQSALAITDAHGVYGAPQFHVAAKKLRIKALIGAEVKGAKDCRFTLLAESRHGYQNLCRLITHTKLRETGGGKADGHFATDDDLTKHAPGLVCLTGGAEGMLASIYRNCRGVNAEQQATAHINSLIQSFGRESVFIEIQRHYCRRQEARNQALVQLARKLQLPLLATNGVAYADPDKRDLQDLLTCIKEKLPIAEAGVLLNNNAERYVKSSEQMRRLFADLPEAIANTTELAERLQFTLEDLGYQFPRYPVPSGETEMSYLRKLTAIGARERFQNYSKSEIANRVQPQLEKELALIERRALPGYFLIVWNLIDFCRNEKILVQGRGSAANSAVCYALGITAIDPVRMNLLFERFLSDERDEMPDIDLDLPSGDQRERVIQFVYKSYGQLGAAMTANVISYRGRSAVRDVGKALGFDEAETAKLASQLNAFEWKDSRDQLEHRFREGGYDLRDQRIAKFFSLTSEILALPRHLGQHSGGMVICQGELNSVVPLEPASMHNRVVVQWDKDDCAELGIIKIDLLGLGMMSVLEDSIQIIQDSYGEKVDLANLPQDDEKVYDCLQKADTVGLFQVESRAQMSCLPRLKPATFYDIVVQVAIIRPGPIVGQMLHPYLKRRQGLEEVVCLHPSLEEVLARTLGVPLFQEQLIRIAMITADFTGGQAEELRRAFGFKRSEKRMREVEVQLRLGMDRKGITGETQEKIIKAITSFALYGFPESHAASFALIAYASTYLKCHYLPAFTAAMLNNQPMGFYSAATLVKDAQRHGQRFRPVDVLKSDFVCTVEKEGGHKWIRLGLNYVRGLRSATAREIERQRKLKAFISLHDLVLRVPEMHKDEISKLAELGALNELPRFEADRHRRGALWQAELAVKPVGELLETAAVDTSHSPLTPMTPGQRTTADFSNSGLTIGKHPMSFHRARMRKMGVLDSATAKLQRNGTVMKVAGCVITRQRPGTAKGFVFLSLEDEAGIVNIIVRPDLFDRKRLVCTTSPYLLIKGVLQSITGVISLKAGDIEELTFRESAVMQSHDFH